MKKINTAIIGFGNIGQYAVSAVRAAEDMELRGIIVRDLARTYPGAEGIPVVNDIKELLPVDIALLCLPTRSVEEEAKKLLSMGINTVDSFDIHSSINDLRRSLDATAKQHNAVSVISAGWDPGSDSVIRTLMQAMAPKGITYTNFGPGMSMGHTVAAKAVKGVKKALALTIPCGAGIHRRMVYIEADGTICLENIEKELKADPYFSHDETRVIHVKDVDALLDKGHSVSMQRKGVSGNTDNQLFEFSMKVHNPALTSQVMVCCARASLRQKPGAYTMIEIPVIDLLPGEREDIIRDLV